MELETEASAAAFRRLVMHLRSRSDVQNIELMNLAGFCRNCLADWYREAANARGATLDKDAARELVHGMPVAEWKARHQAPVDAAQQSAFESAVAAARGHSPTD